MGADAVFAVVMFAATPAARLFELVLNVTREQTGTGVGVGVGATSVMVRVGPVGQGSPLTEVNLATKLTAPVPPARFREFVILNEVAEEVPVGSEIPLIKLLDATGFEV